MRVMRSCGSFITLALAFVLAASCDSARVSRPGTGGIGATRSIE